LYDAHLDTQLVHSGAYVRVGDTLGLVGTTGNARGTLAHLHFGIYRRGEGALDPYPFIHATRERPAAPADTSTLGRWARIARGGAELRPAPDDRAARLSALPRYTAVRVMAATGRWLRVALPDGARGYVPASRTEAASRPIRTERPRSAVAVRDRPAAVAAVMDSIGPGEAIPVYGRFGQFLYVHAPGGRAGWMAED
jgi:SH3-like domain-containing protein